MTYIFLTSSVVSVGGAQLYISRKVDHLLSLGWEVHVFSVRHGEIVIENLKQYEQEINRMLNNWCNVAQLTYSGNGSDRTYSCWSWSITDPGHSVGDDFERLVDVFNNRADWSYFYYATLDS